MIGSLFNVESSKRRFDANKVELTEKGHPYIVRQSLNNGQKGKIEEDETYLNEGNTISFGQDTATVFYQEKPYYTGDKIKILKPKDKRFRKQNAPFFLAAIHRAFCGFSWGTQSFSVRVIERTRILLPQTPYKDIDFAFIESFVRELEESRLRELEAYLSATGLKDYNLTSSDRLAINEFNNLRWGQFQMRDLFERIETKKLPYKAKELPSQPQGNNILPCLTSSFMNQGLNYYAPRTGATILRNVISIPSNSDVYRAYYQSNDFTVLSDAYAIRWKDENVRLNSKQYLFLVASINKVTDLPIFSYKNKLGGWNVVKNKHITLPVNELGQPDLQKMEALVGALQKIVIKDVAQYTERNLETTRDIVNRGTDSLAIKTVYPIYQNHRPGCVPIYSLRAACGRFEGNETPVVEGWVDASGYGFTPDKEKHFAVYAKGNSMQPLINDGDLCIFEWYNAGSRNGEIVLTQCGEFDSDYDGRYTIKRYESKKTITRDSWQHTKIQLRPLNAEYDTVEIEGEDALQYRTIGILKTVIH